MALVSTLQNILNKFRLITGTGTSRQITTDDIMVLINSFYLYDFPAQFRSLKLKDKYVFNCIAGVDVYPFNSEQYTTIEQPVYCAKRPIALYDDPNNFYAANYNGVGNNWQDIENFTFGNGTVGPYSGFTTGFPIIRSANNASDDLNYPASITQNILITTSIENGVTLFITDQPIINSNTGQLNQVYTNGNILFDNIGLINYQTGEISNLIFNEVVPGGINITIEYNPVVLNTPLSILFFQDQFTLRPVPDQGYTIELVAYRQPTQALANTPAFQGTPELSEWWETIAWGAALKFFENKRDESGIANAERALANAYALNQTRTYAQLGKQSISTIYSDQLYNNFNNNGFGAGSFG
jgi:hypothetical protein